MKILIVSQYFWPETFRINDLVKELVERGHDVSVLTGKPNYPQGKIYKGYGFFSHNRDVYYGAKVYRVPLIPRGKGTGLHLVFNYLSYVVSASTFVAFNRKKFDVSLTFAISPITQMYPALLHKKLYGSRAYLWVQDLWPESVAAAGKMGSPTVINALTKMVRNIYKKTDGVLVQSEAFIPSIVQKGISQDKIEFIPNWAEDIFTKQFDANIDKYKSIIPDGFVVMFAGNIGEAQDFESIVNAAERTKHIKDIKWVIVGDGRKKDWVEKEVAARELSETFFLLGRYPVEEMPYFFNNADILLLTLKDEEIFSLTIPSKVQSYLAFGKPIASMINGIGNKVINDAQCGFTANAGDADKLAENIIKAYNAPASTLKQLGTNGKDYYTKEFDKAAIIDRLEEIFYNNL
jgi:glycosyltransferase involved in cell wall biosynthesis